MKRSRGPLTEGENRYPDDTNPTASGAPEDELIGELCTTLPLSALTSRVSKITIGGLVFPPECTDTIQPSKQVRKSILFI